MIPLPPDLSPASDPGVMEAGGVGPVLLVCALVWTGVAALMWWWCLLLARVPGCVDIGHVLLRVGGVCAVWLMWCAWLVAAAGLSSDAVCCVARC